jgi:hypothetical protein
MNRLTRNFAYQFSQFEREDRSVNKRFRKSRQGVRENKPVPILQLCSLPIVLNIDNFKRKTNPIYEPRNIGSNLLFSELADSIPLLLPKYCRSQNSVKEIWGNILNTASATSNYTTRIISESKDKFDSARFSGIAGYPDDWYPVGAVPVDWSELLEDERNLVQIEIDMERDNDPSGFITIEDDADHLSWHIFERKRKKKKQINLAAASSIKKIVVKVLKVDFVRHWFNFEFFSVSNWGIEGVPIGYFSTGKLVGNKGVFPLLTQSVLIGHSVTIEGDFDPRDRLIFANRDRNKSLSLGPFSLDQNTIIENEKGVEVIKSNVKHVIGFISMPIPLSPAVSM